MKGVPDAFKMETAEQKAEVKRVHDMISASIPMDKLDERRQHRDLVIQKLVAAKKACQ